MLAKDEYTGEMRIKIEEPDVTLATWVPTVIHHAVEKYGKVMFINSDHYLAENGFEWLEEQLHMHGHVFMSFPDRSAYTVRVQVHVLCPLVNPSDCGFPIHQGYIIGGEAYESIIVPRARCAFSPCASQSLTFDALQAFAESKGASFSISLPLVLIL